MWTLISGYIVSNIFECLTIKLHKNNLSNKNMSIFGIVLGWLFQEHVKQDFYMTGGKRFMLKRDFRNRFITQTVKIIRNMIFWVYAINIFELGTFLVIFSYFVYILMKICFDKNYLIKITKLLKEFNFLISLKNYKRLEPFISSFFSFFFKIVNKKSKDFFIFFISFIFFKYGLFKIYGWFDFFFTVQPFFYILIILYTLTSLIWLSYLFYFFMIKYLPSKFSYTVNVCLYRNYFYLILICFLCDLTLKEVNIANLTTENFFKELLSKVLLLFF